MFEAQYQTSRLREDLLQAAFDQRTGCDNTHLFAFLRNMSISRDVDAPMDLNPDDWLGFHGRRDATRLRNAISTVQAAKDQAAKDQPFYDENKTKELGTLTELLRLLRSRDRALRHAWSKLKLADIRQKYFREADRARAVGKEPPRVERIVSNITAVIRVLKSNAQVAEQVFQHFVRKWNISNDDEDQGRYIDLLIAYGKGCLKAELDVWEDEYESLEEYDEDDQAEEDDDDDTDECDDYDCSEDNKTDSIADEEMEENWKCVICDLSFSSRKTLTSHFNRHKRAQYFNIKNPRRCPACRKDKTKTRNDCLVESGLLAWFNHLERFHGPYSLPYTPSDLKDPARYPCPFPDCKSKGKDKLFNVRGLSVHITKAHKAQLDEGIKDRFKTKVRCHQCCSCKRCDSPGVGHTVLVESIARWKSHFDIFHADEKRIAYQCFICQDTVRTSQGLKSHFSNLHERREGYFAKPFSCPECIRTGNIDPPIIQGRKAWQAHIDDCHDGAAKEYKPEELTESSNSISHYPCLVCGRCYHERSYLQEHLKLAHKELIRKNHLKCPQCERQLTNINAWIHHTIREHQMCESMRSCTVGSGGNETPIATDPTYGGETIGEESSLKIFLRYEEDPNATLIYPDPTYGAETIDEESNFEMFLSYEEDRPAEDELAVKEVEYDFDTSFNEQRTKRKRNLLDEVLLSVGNELLPHQRLRYSIPGLDIGSQFIQDNIPVDPDLMEWGNTIPIECI